MKMGREIGSHAPIRYKQRISWTRRAGKASREPSPDQSNSATPSR